MSLSCVVFSLSDDLTKRSRNDSPAFLAAWVAHHCMSFATTSLSIGKNGPVVAVKDTFYKKEGTLFVNATLSRIWSEDIIEGECLGLLFSIFFSEINLFVLAIHIDNIDAT